MSVLKSPILVETQVSNETIAESNLKLFEFVWSGYSDNGQWSDYSTDSGEWLVKTVPNNESEKKRMRLSHREENRQADRKRGMRKRQREHTLI